MADEVTNLEIKRLKEAALQVIESSFNQRRQVVLLSYVGQTISRQGFDLKTLLGEVGFAKFVRENLSDKVEIVSMPSDPKVLAAYPKGVDLEKEIDPFGKQRRGSAPEASTGSQQSHHRLLVNRYVWFAFSHTLAEGFQRSLQLEPTVSYTDSPAGENVSGIPVPSDFIIPSGTLPPDERNEKIYSNILQWAETNSIEFSSIAQWRKTREGYRSALDVLLDSLRPHDLERINIPLDIINSLRTKRI